MKAAVASQEASQNGPSAQLIGPSTAMEAIRSLIAQVAPSEASVLILGESGTGKEVVARGVHQLSKRSRGPFVPVNCGAIPGELLESELFGHEKGAFTGAISSRQGRFEMAAGGTLFLDEIGDMPLQMQVKLLRVLQERSFERVGSNRTQQCDVRVIAATHQDLERRVEDGEFRMDLFYRLNVFPIEVPPLRGRPEDIPALVRRFVTLLEREDRGTVRVAEDAMASLQRYPWPGNVRELSNLVERLAILHPDAAVTLAELPVRFRTAGTSPVANSSKQSPSEPVSAPVPAPIVGRADRDALLEPLFGDDTDRDHQHGDSQDPQDSKEVLPSDAGAAPVAGALLDPQGMDLKAHLADVERSLMVQALEHCDWVVARAAKMLGLQRTTLVEKMRKYAIARPDEPPEY